jgi:hypothetical protein
MIDRKELIEKLNGLCWSARRYGHDDNGLDYGVTIDGVELDGYEDVEDEDVDTYHPEAVALADELLELLS